MRSAARPPGAPPSLGPKPAGATARIRPLGRRMGVLGVLLLTLSAATPAASLFVIVPDVLHGAGSGALAAMALAAVVAAAMAQVYAELGSAFPYAGGEYAMVARTCGPASGFAVLALNLMNSVLTAAVFALGVADFLHAAWPVAAPVPVALGVVALAAGVGLLDIRAGGGVTGAFLLVEALAVGTVAVAGALHPVRALAPMLAHPVRIAAGGALPVPPAALLLAASVALFAYDGYGSAVYFAEELGDARRRVARAVGLALVCAVAAELLPLALALVGAPDLGAFLGSPAPMQALIAARLGRGAAAAVSVGVGLAVVNAVVALVLLSGRQVYALARDGVWPGARLNAALGWTGPRSQAPAGGTLAASAAAAALCFAPLRLLLILTGTGITAIYAALCVALLLGRRRGRLAAAAHRAPFHPVLPALTLAALAGVLVADAADADEGRPSLLVTAGVLALGAAWGARTARSGRWRLTAPADDDAPPPPAPSP